MFHQCVSFKFWFLFFPSFAFLYYTARHSWVTFPYNNYTYQSILTSLYLLLHNVEQNSVTSKEREKLFFQEHSIQHSHSYFYFQEHQLSELFCSFCSCSSFCTSWCSMKCCRACIVLIKRQEIKFFYWKI